MSTDSLIAVKMWLEHASLCRESAAQYMVDESLSIDERAQHSGTAECLAKMYERWAMEDSPATQVDRP